MTKITMMRLIIISVLALGATLGAVAVNDLKPHPKPSCVEARQPFTYTLCQFNPKANTQLRLVWQGANHQPLLTFNQLRQYLASPTTSTHWQSKSQADQTKPQTLLFGMNAGMYDEKFAPIGYTVINGKEIRSLNLKQGGGNFHLMPNGVFWWDKTGFYVTESNAMAKLLQAGKKPLYATQSGPMLVINGKIHPSFDPKSTSYKMRNGVGVCRDGQVKLVISDTPVSFYQFANVFKTQLGCDNALFLDGGQASALYSQELQRNDSEYMGVMVVGVN
ncbi:MULTISPECIES: phosphodiester glycosidase family protein [unclassified Moraxella]|uniref:phosphodiester glycosidase family protein n=1 Tax=unclassified Moraxella TaxID=2685852 RepID=UPI003AF8B552